MPDQADSSNGAGRVGLVLSGGGARGAYEAGVLSYLLDNVPARTGKPVRFDIITGSSVGAIHACYLAATQGEPGAAARLLNIWESLSFESIFEVGVTDVVRVPWRLLGAGAVVPLPASTRLPERLPGLFDTSRLESLVLDRVAWPNIQKNLESGSISALALVATEIATGRSVVFVDNASGELPEWTRDPYIVPRLARIDARHALASAAIPLVFPAVRIDRTYYCDGGLRLNTPLVPALRLGAEKVLIIGLRYRPSPEDEDRLARRREANFMSITYLAGKALNALLLDRIETDVERLRLFNAILESGSEIYGPEFIDRINEPIIAARNTPYRIVPDMFIQPSRDLGELAAECLEHRAPRSGLRNWLSRNVARYAARGAVTEADLLSYLFFDSCYAEHLIELGRKDAEAKAEELAAFFN